MLCPYATDRDATPGPDAIRARPLNGMPAPG